MTTSVDDRIQHRAFPPNMPGSCVCGKATDEKGFADINFFIEWHGNIYLCSNCAETIGRVFGMITPEEYEQDKQLLAEAQARLVDLVNSVERLESTVDALSLERLAARSVSVVEPEPVAVSEEPEDSDDELDALLREADSIINESADAGEADDEAADEPVVIEGPDDTSESNSGDLGVGELGI